MEVIVSLEDTTTLELTQELSKRFDQLSRGAREGAVNPDAPACTLEFDTSVLRRDFSPHELLTSPLNFSFIL